MGIFKKHIYSLCVPSHCFYSQYFYGCHNLQVHSNTDSQNVSMEHGLPCTVQCSAVQLRTVPVSSSCSHLSSTHRPTYVFKKIKERFLAAKRSSTRALVLCLSVRPSVVKTEFLIVWSAYDNLWQPMSTYDNLWQLMTAYDNLWQLMTAYDNLWQLMTSYDSFWQLLTAFDNFWQLMPTI